MTFASALLAVLVVAASPPKTASVSAAARFQAGQIEFNRGDFAGALRTLDAAAAGTSDEATLAKIHLLRGQCFGARQDFAAVEQAFALALENDPEVGLDPSKVDPALVRVLDGLRSRLRGELRVRADKPAAQVMLDGKMVGQVPLRSSVPIGRHTVEVKTPDGAYGASRAVVIRVRQPTDVAMELRQPPARPGIGSDSPRAEAEGPRPYGDLRSTLDPFRSGSVLGFEVGGGVEYQHLRGSASAILYPDFGIDLRGALSVPVEDHFNIYASLELPIIFASSTAFGLGGAGGIEYEVSRWFEPFLEVGVRHFFTGTGDADPNRLVFQFGIRLKLP